MINSYLFVLPFLAPMIQCLSDDVRPQKFHWTVSMLRCTQAQKAMHTNLDHSNRAHLWLTPDVGFGWSFLNQSHESRSHEFHSEFSLIQQPERRKNRSKYRITAEMWRITSVWITPIGAGLSSFKAYPEMKRSNSSYLRLGWRVPSSWKLPWMFLPHWRGGFPRPMRNSRALRVKCGIGRPGEGIPFRGSHVSPERLWSTWNPKQPFINGCFNWMILNLYRGNGCLTKHPI